MSLDDLIKTSKKSGSGNARGRGRASGPGPARRLPNRAANRTTPYAAAKVEANLSGFGSDLSSQVEVELN